MLFCLGAVAVALRADHVLRFSWGWTFLPFFVALAGVALFLALLVGTNADGPRFSRIGKAAGVAALTLLVEAPIVLFLVFLARKVVLLAGGWFETKVAAWVSAVVLLGSWLEWSMRREWRMEW